MVEPLSSLEEAQREAGYSMKCRADDEIQEREGLLTHIAELEKARDEWISIAAESHERNRRLLAQLQRAREALEPFAVLAESLSDSVADDQQLKEQLGLYPPVLATVGSCRRAAKALADLPGAEPRSSMEAKQNPLSIPTTLSRGHSVLGQDTKVGSGPPIEGLVAEQDPTDLPSAEPAGPTGTERPTIKELEEILRQNPQPNIRFEADGQVYTGPSDTERLEQARFALEYVKQHGGTAAEIRKYAAQQLAAIDAMEAGDA
jgi:hypothetical protein